MNDDYVKFTPDMNILEALMLGPEVREVFRKLGLKCVDRRERGSVTEYCVAAEREPLSIAGMYHDQDVRAILNQLNSLRVKPLSQEEEERGGR